MKKQKESGRKAILRDIIIQLIVGILVALFSFWLNKTFGFGINVNGL